MNDDRVSCTACANFDGTCTAADKAVPGAWIFMPTLVDIPRRCIFYVPRRGDPDKRTGAQRWPEFVTYYKAVRIERARVRREMGERGMGRVKAAIGQQQRDLMCQDASFAKGS